MFLSRQPITTTELKAFLDTLSTLFGVQSVSNTTCFLDELDLVNSKNLNKVAIADISVKPNSEAIFNVITNSNPIKFASFSCPALSDLKLDTLSDTYITILDSELAGINTVTIQNLSMQDKAILSLTEDDLPSIYLNFNNNNSFGCKTLEVELPIAPGTKVTAPPYGISRTYSPAQLPIDYDGTISTTDKQQIGFQRVKLTAKRVDEFTASSFSSIAHSINTNTKIYPTSYDTEAIAFKTVQIPKIRSTAYTFRALNSWSTTTTQISIPKQTPTILEYSFDYNYSYYDINKCCYQDYFITKDTAISSQVNPDYTGYLDITPYHSLVTGFTIIPNMRTQPIKLADFSNYYYNNMLGLDCISTSSDLLSNIPQADHNTYIDISSLIPLISNPNDAAKATVFFDGYRQIQGLWLENNFVGDTETPYLKATFESNSVYDYDLSTLSALTINLIPDSREVGNTSAISFFNAAHTASMYSSYGHVETYYNSFDSSSPYYPETYISAAANIEIPYLFDVFQDGPTGFAVANIGDNNLGSSFTLLNITPDLEYSTFSVYLQLSSNGQMWEEIRTSPTAWSSGSYGSDSAIFKLFTIDAEVQSTDTNNYYKGHDSFDVYVKSPLQYLIKYLLKDENNDVTESDAYISSGVGYLSNTLVSALVQDSYSSNLPAGISINKYDDDDLCCISYRTSSNNVQFTINADSAYQQYYEPQSYYKLTAETEDCAEDGIFIIKTNWQQNPCVLPDASYSSATATLKFTVSK